MSRFRLVLRISALLVFLAVLFVLLAFNYVFGLVELPLSNRRHVPCIEYLSSFSWSQYQLTVSRLGARVFLLVLWTTVPFAIVHGVAFGRRWWFVATTLGALVFVIATVFAVLHAWGCWFAATRNCFVTDGECVYWWMLAVFGAFVSAALGTALSGRRKRGTGHKGLRP